MVDSEWAIRKVQDTILLERDVQTAKAMREYAEYTR
jgi:hypothetical protein